MATIRTNTKNNRFWDEWATLFDAVIYDADAQRNKYDDIVSALTMEKKSNRWGEKSIVMGGLGDFQAKAEGANAAEDTFSQGYEKFVEHITFAQEVVISKELKDDNMLDDAKNKVINMVQSYKRTRAKLATAAITSAVGATENITFNGATVDVTCGDGLALFNEAHKLKNANGYTQPNYFNDVLGSSTKVLNEAANKMRNFRDDRGEVLGFTADTIIVPGNDPEYEDFVKRVIGSDGEVGSDHNDINTQRGKWKLVVDPLWTPTISATNHPLIIYSSEALKALQGVKFYDRTDLDIENDVDVHSRNLTYNGFARMSITFPNWRHAMMIGASASSSSVEDGDIYSG